MNRKPHNPLWLYLGISLLCAWGWIVATTPPMTTWVIVLFFALLFSALFCSIYYITRNPTRAGIYATGLIIFLLLRYFDLRNPLFSILLIASIISLEFSLRHR